MSNLNKILIACGVILMITLLIMVFVMIKKKKTNKVPGLTAIEQVQPTNSPVTQTETTLPREKKSIRINIEDLRIIPNFVETKGITDIAFVNRSASVVTLVFANGQIPNKKLERNEPYIPDITKPGEYSFSVLENPQLQGKIIVSGE